MEAISGTETNHNTWRCGEGPTTSSGQSVLHFVSLDLWTEQTNVK